MLPKLRVTLKIAQFQCDPALVTEHLEMIPTATWRKGDLIGRSSRRYVENGWSLRTSLPESTLIDEQISQILTPLLPRLETLEQVTGGHYIEIACAAYMESETPPLHINASTLQLICGISADIDVALYVVAEE